MKLFFSNKKSAFSLIEIMVIIAIVLVGMIGVLSLLVQNMQAQTINKNRFIAYQMAQEGIEITRALRDTYFVNDIGGDFRADFPADAYIYTYSPGEHPALEKFNGNIIEQNVCLDTAGFYNSYHHCPNQNLPNTIFTRILKLSYSKDDKNNDFLRVVSGVTWNERGKSYNYSLETHLYDWY